MGQNISYEPPVNRYPDEPQWGEGGAQLRNGGNNASELPEPRGFVEKNTNYDLMRVARGRFRLVRPRRPYGFGGGEHLGHSVFAEARVEAMEAIESAPRGIVLGGKTRHVEMGRRGLDRDRRGIPDDDRQTRRPDKWTGVLPDELGGTIELSDLSSNENGSRRVKRIVNGPLPQSLLAVRFIEAGIPPRVPRR